MALTLTPGIPPIEHITILPRGGVQSRVLFTPVVSRPWDTPVFMPPGITHSLEACDARAYIVSM